MGHKKWVRGRICSEKIVFMRSGVGLRVFKTIVVGGQSGKVGQSGLLENGFTFDGHLRQESSERQGQKLFQKRTRGSRKRSPASQLRVWF